MNATTLTLPLTKPWERTPETVIEMLVADRASQLDEIEPGWATKVNVHKLNLNSGCNCVLGQVYGNFNDGMFDAVSQLGTAFGRDADLVFLESPGARDAWVREIEKRRGEE